MLFREDLLLSDYLLKTHSGDCYYCQDGHTSRCTQSLLFGSPNLNGGQAEFVRVPLADGSVMKAPKSVSDQALVLMADIFPTGYYGVRSAIELCPKVKVQDSVMVIIGCGPVGLCAIAAATHFGPMRIFAIDSVDSRLELARGLGAEPLNFLHDKDGMLASIKAATNGRGADMVVEVVGQPAALKTAYDVVRPFGSISSIGVHGAEVCLVFIDVRVCVDDELTRNARFRLVVRKDMSKSTTSSITLLTIGLHLSVVRIFACKWAGVPSVASLPSLSLF